MKKKRKRQNRTFERSENVGTRNENGFLTLWRIKPKREGGVWIESRHILRAYMAIEDDEIESFSNIKWEDEPVEVELSKLI